MSESWSERAHALPGFAVELGLRVTSFSGTGAGAYQALQPASSDVVLILGCRGSRWDVDDARHAAFVVGPATRPVRVGSVDAGWACVEVRVPPPVAARLWPTSPPPVGACDLGDRMADDLVRELSETARPGEVIERLTDRLLSRLAQPTRREHPDVRWAWDEIIRTSGRVGVRELARETQWSQRRFTTRFRQVVGVGPKAAARIVRFEAAQRAVETTSRPLARVAVDAGFSDQAHMTRELVALGGVAPGALRRGER